MVKLDLYTYRADTGKIFINKKKERFPLIVVPNKEELAEYTEVAIKELNKPKRERK